LLIILHIKNKKIQGVVKSYCCRELKAGTATDLLVIDDQVNVRVAWFNF
jgi:hypothetical protein